MTTFLDEKTVARTRSTGRPDSLARAVALSMLSLFLLCSAAIPSEGETADGPDAAHHRESGRPVVGFVSGHGEPTPLEGLATAAEALSADFDVRLVDLTRDRDALDDLAAIVVAGAPDILDTELYELDQYLMRGGRVAFFIDAATVPLVGFDAGLAGGNIIGFLKAYGIVVNPDLVLDIEGAVSAVYGDVATDMLYPFWPLVGGEGIATSHPALSGFETVPFAWTSSLDIAEGALELADVTVLLKSSGYSWHRDAFVSVDPLQSFAPRGEGADVILAGGGSGFTLAVEVSGEIDSAFRGRRLIVQSGKNVEFTDPEGMIERSAPTRVIVFGSSRLFRDTFAEQLTGNPELFAGMISWLALSDAPAPVRTRPDDPTGSAPGGSTVLWVIVGVLIVAGGLVAFSVWRGRRGDRATG